MAGRDYGLDYGLPPSQLDIMRQVARRQSTPIQTDFRKPFRPEEIDQTQPTWNMPRKITPLDPLNATSTATGRLAGSLLDKPGDLTRGLFEAGKGARDVFTKGESTGFTAEMDKRSGVKTPWPMALATDAMTDIGNVLDPLKALGAGLGVKAMLPVAGTIEKDAIRELAKKGLKSIKSSPGVVAREGEEAIRLGEMVDKSMKNTKSGGQEVQDLLGKLRGSLDKDAAIRAERAAAEEAAKLRTTAPKPVNVTPGRPGSPPPRTPPHTPPAPPTPPGTPPGKPPTPNPPNPTPTPTPNKAIKIGKNVADAVNQLRIASMLSGWALPKSVLGNVGSPFIATAENLAAGKGGASFAPIKEALNVGENLKQFGQGWKQGANPTIAGSSGVGKYNPITRTMNAADYATTEGLKRAGLSEEEAQRLLLRSPKWGLKGPRKGPGNPIIDYLVPFKRTPFNVLQGGADTIMKHPYLSAGAGAAGVGIGSQTDDPRALALSAAPLGPYGLPFVLGAATTAGMRALGGLSPIPDWSLERSIGDPLHPFTAPAFTTMFKDSGKKTTSRPSLRRGRPTMPSLRRR